MKLKTSEPFWLVKNGILNSYPSLNKDIEVDVLVVGAGITGSLIAHQAIRDGYKTAILDRREVCNGSTSATTSMLQYEIDVALHELKEMIGEKAAEESYWACFDSIDTLGKICEEVGSQCGFKKKKSLYFASYKKDVPWLEKEFKARKAAGFPVRWMESEEIEKRYGITNTHGAILSDQGASIDAFQLAHDILHYNNGKGLEIYDKTQIEDITYKESAVRVTTNYGDTIKAKKIIYCTGFESTEIIKDKFVQLLSTYAIVGEKQHKKSVLEDLLVWNTADPYLYMRTTDDNRLLIGGEDEDFVDAQKRDGMLAKKSEKLKKTLAKHFPQSPMRIDFSWAGTFGETKDGLPYIGVHPNFPGAYFVLGFGGNGITFSVIGMDLVSAHLKGEEHALEHNFRFRR